jgi:hypothetical protein
MAWLSSALKQEPMLHGGLCQGYLIAPERVQFTSGGADQGVSVSTRHLQPATMLAVPTSNITEGHEWGGTPS